MPGFDRTGPTGAGSRSGRGMGLCRGYARTGMGSIGNMFRGLGRGLASWGGGRGRCFGGWGAGGNAPLSTPASTAGPDEASMLRKELADLQNYVADLKARIEELDKRG